VNFRRILKGPIFWIVLAIAAVLIGSSLLSSVGGPENVDTGVAVADIQAGKVDTATLIDRDQVLELTLKDGSQARTSYITGQGVNLQELLQEKADAGQLPGGYNVIVPTESLLVTLLVSLLPVILIVFLLFFFMGQMQGGGNNELRQVQGEGHHEGHATDDVRRRSRCGRGCRGIAGDQGVPC